jgi:PAS domain S-box-containing protein
MTDHPKVDELSFQQALNALLHPAVVIDSGAVIRWGNTAWQTLTLEGQSWIGQSYLSFCETAWQKSRQDSSLEQGIRDVLSGKRSSFRFESHKDERHYDVSVTPLAKNAQGALILHTDSTEAFQTSAQMTMLLESPIDALIVVDQHGLIQMVNTQMEKMFGYSRDELFGQTMEILLPHRFRPQHRQHLQRYMEHPKMRPMGTGLELWGMSKEGREFPVEISLNPLQTTGAPLVSAAIRDVSERKLAEKQVARLARILEASDSEIYLFDAVTLRFTFANQGALQNTGYTATELQDLTPLDLALSEDVASFEARLGALRNQRDTTLQFSSHCRRKDGSFYPVDIHLQLFGSEQPPVFSIVAFDTSEREATQKALRESQQRVAMHVASTPLAVLEWRSEDGIITAWNPAAERIFGYSATEVVGQRHANFITPEDTRGNLKKIWSGQFAESGFRSTLKNLRKDGRMITCEWYTTLIQSDDQRVAALALDVTARQRAINDLVTVQEEERSRISRDLHDHVGQLLTGLNLGLSAAIDNPKPQKLLELKRLGAVILDDVRRISRDMRPALLDELGLEAAIRRFSRELIKENLEVDILVRVPETLERNTATVIYRVTQEALTNIVRHADARHASVIVTTSSEGLQLIVEDDGIGFDPNLVTATEHIGLSSMRERVELLGGTFAVESSLESGTTISAKLPLP